MRRLLLCLLCFLWTVGGALPASGQPPAESVDVYSRPRQAERSRTYDVQHYRIELHFDETTKSFEGRSTITLVALRDRLTQATLDAETFRVTAVTDEDGRTLQFEQPPHELVVHFQEPATYGERVTFTVAYHADRVDVVSEDFGMSAGYDLGIDFKDATPENPRLINTLSFPEGARHWFPCYDHPNDRATQETIVSVRSDYRVLSNGRLVDVSENAERRTKTFHWSQERPHPTYLFVLVAGPYVVLEDALGELPIHYWVYPQDVDDAPRSFERTPEIVAFFEGTYGVPFPWSKYDQVTIPGIGGGAESTTATVLGQSTIHDARAEQDFSSHGLVAHEAAHQWWGNLVSYRDWAHTWISESFATYSEYLWTRHARGDDEGAQNLLQKKESYLREAHTRYMRPIVFDRWRFPNDNFDGHTYPKGAAVIHMLQDVMGAPAFFRALTHFLEKHAYQAVDTHDLAVAIKEATGQNLDWFFEQWVFSPGHPVFDVAYTWEPATSTMTTGTMKLSIDQVQDTKRGVPVFRLPINLKVVTDEGDVVHRVWLDEPGETVSLKLPAAPRLVRFDEDNVLLKEWTFTKAKDELLYQLTRDDVIGRSWAASQLAGHLDDPGVILALKERAVEDAFWHVRRTAVEQIGALSPRGDQGGETLLDPEYADFMKQRSLDPHSQVRAAALQALGELRKPALVDFLKDRFAEDDSYVAQAAALRALGRCGDRTIETFLKEAAQVPSPRNVLRSAAEWALEQLNP